MPLSSLVAEFIGLRRFSARNPGFNLCAQLIWQIGRLLDRQIHEEVLGRFGHTPRSHAARPHRLSALSQHRREKAAARAVAAASAKFQAEQVISVSTDAARADCRIQPISLQMALARGACHK